MKDIQASLFETMKAFSDNAKNTSNAALIEEGTITEVLDAGLGEYSLEFMDNTFTVYASNQNITYSVGDNVYFSVPKGDFSKNKIIIGLVNPKIEVFVDNTDSNTQYYDISDNLIDIDFDTIKMSSYDTIEEERDISGYTASIFANIFNNYCEDNRTFAFGFSAKTNMLINQQNSGNYGIKLNIPLIANAAAGQGQTEVVWKSYQLDVSNMLGNPYRYEAWSPQVVYFTIDSQYKIANDIKPTLTYFCYGFRQDESKKDIKDIFIKNISLKAVDILTIDETTGYNLTIKATEGTYFHDKYASTKILTPTLRVNGKKTTLKPDSCEVYWFVENAKIKTDDKYYCSYGGFGWKCLNDKTPVAPNEDGSETFNWITTNSQLTVKKSDIGDSARFKCVVVYKDKVISDIIILKKLNSDRSLELKATNGSNVFLKDTGYVYLTSIVYIDNITDKEKYKNSVLYSWSRYNKDGNFINDDESFFQIVKFNEINNGKYETEIRFPVNEIEDYNFIYCSATFVDSEINESLVGTKEITISTSTEFNYTLTIDGDDVIYKYDSNGDSPAGTAYDGPSTSKVTNISPLSFTIRKVNGEELTKEEYSYVKYKWSIPKKSMFVKTSEATSEDDDNYYFEGYDNFHNNNTLQYKIANRYNVSKVKQPIQLTIVLQDTVLQRNANIDFIKEGENGSNGTAYAARLVAGGLTPDTSVPYGTLNDQGVAQKLKFLYNISNSKLYLHDVNTNTLLDWTEHKRRIYPRVYKDSEELDKSKYRVTFKMFDEKVTEPCFYVYDIDSNNGVRLELNKDILLGSKYCNILEANITIAQGNTSIVDSAEHIYVYYPIELTIVNFNSSIIPSLDGGFAEVMYASDGTNPSWDETSNFIVNDDSIILEQKDYISEYYKLTWETQNHLDIKKQEDNSADIEPHNKYDDGNSKNYIRTIMRFNTEKEEELNNRISSLETEKTGYENNIAGARNNKLYLENFASLYKGQKWEDIFNNIQILFNTQTIAVYNAEKILHDSLVKIQNYFTMQKNYGNINPTQISELTNQISILQTETEKAVVQIKMLNGTEGYDYKDLISLANYRINYNEEFYKNLLGLDIALNIGLLVKDINSQIDEYQKNYEKLISFEGTNYLSEYLSVLIDIQSMCNAIPSDAYDNILDIKNKVLVYAEQFNNYTSIRDLKALILAMYNNALKSMFDLIDNKLYINNITNEYFENIINENQEKIDDNNRNIEILEHIKDTKNREIIHIRPIVLYFNRYEKSNLNAWDGNKIETGGDDGSYLLAPQVGAGRKESDNSFTGVVIGQRNLDGGVGTTTSAQTGIFGYGHGKQSLFVNAENGSSIFGIAGAGQIIVDPTANKGLLYSSNYWKNYNKNTQLPTNYTRSNWNGQGMCIDLSTPEIRFGSGNFVVDSNGEITAKGGGTIAGWKISDTQIYSNIAIGSGRLTLDSEGTGKIYSHSHTTLDSTNTGFYLSADGLSIGNNIRVNAVEGGSIEIGRLSSQRHWTINGDSENSYIAYGTKGSANSVYIGTNEIHLGSKLRLYNDGSLEGGAENFYGDRRWNIGADGTATFKYLVANNGGSIGGWTIGSNSLSASDAFGNYISISATGSIDSSKWHIRSNGTAEFRDVVITGGEGANSYMNWADGRFSVNTEGYLSATGASFDNVKLNNGLFNVDSAGNLTASAANITGIVNATRGRFGNVAINSDGSISNGNFNVSADGNLTATNATLNGTVSANGVNFSGDNTSLKMDGDGGYIETSSIRVGSDQRDGHINIKNGFIASSGYSTYDSTGSIKTGIDDTVRIGVWEYQFVNGILVSTRIS